ncbi:hypothetical protein FNF27_03337 [Cafeteria roenbergensis]|uniref:Uncharacterized protein n=1 Tax=Cafeteria roenbergensis TaxID=33653 RepID=A0A5A8EHD9_CAFRO|nr:hypothetical protein FNF27_03337 [Cafeteria roenbergensis]
MSSELRFSRTPPAQVFTRVELAREALQFFNKLRRAKGLRSTGKEKNFTALLGKLGAASIKLGSGVHIRDVLRRAKVKVIMAGGIDQLAEWHRLGHLRGVADGLAEEVAKRSTIKAAQKHADVLLARAEREAEEQEALRSKMRETLARVDSAISTIPSDSLSEAGAMMHKYTPDKAAELEAKAGETALALDKASKAFAGRIYDTMRSEHGVGPALEAAGLNPQVMSLTAQAVKEPRWLLWEGPSNRDLLARSLACDIAALALAGEGGQLNGRCVFGPRGVGKSSLLVAGCVAAGVFSRIKSLPAAGRPVVPVYVDMLRARWLYELCAARAADSEHAWLRPSAPLPRLLDRALQLAGHRPRVEADPDPSKWKRYPWFATPQQVCEFLEANKLSMLLVMDEADEPYKKCGDIIADELVALRGNSPQMIYYVSGSAAWMRDILFSPDRVDPRIYDVEKFREKTNHSDKQIPLSPLEPLSSLEDHARAIMAAGRAVSSFHSAAKRFLAKSAVPKRRARFGRSILRAGSVLRALLGQPGAHSEKPPLGLDKMQRDIIATQHGRQLSSVFAAHFKSVIKGLRSETVLDQLVSPSVPLSALGLDLGKLSARASEASGADVAAEALLPSLSNLSDCGVLTVVAGEWRPVSWTAVLSIMLIDEGGCSLPFKARDDLSHATVGATTTEPVLAQAFCKSAAKSAHFVGAATEGQRKSLLRSLERLSLVDDAAVAKVADLKWDDVRANSSVLRTGMLFKPSPDKGVDIMLLVRDLDSRLVHLLLLQAKATSSGAAAADKSTNVSLTGWNKIVPGFTAQVKSWGDFHPVSLSLLRDGESLVVWNVVVTNKDVTENALHVTVPAEIGIHEGALRMAMFGGVDGAATSSCGRIHGPHWVVACGDHLLSGLPPAVLDWARMVKRQAWGGHTVAEADGAADQAEA